MPLHQSADYEAIRAKMPGPAEFLQHLRSIVEEQLAEENVTRPPDAILDRLYNASVLTFAEDLFPPYPYGSDSLSQDIRACLEERMQDPWLAYAQFLDGCVEAILTFARRLPPFECKYPAFTFPLTYLLKIDKDPPFHVRESIYKHEAWHLLEDWPYSYYRPIAPHFPHPLCRLPKRTLPRNHTPNDKWGGHFAGRLDGLFDLEFPFPISDEARTEHAWIMARTGHGKTQLIQQFVSADIPAILKSERSVVIIDSQTDMIDKLSRLNVWRDHKDKIIVIDPRWTSHPPALNFFDLGSSNTSDAVLRSRASEMLNYTFSSLLDADLTSKQETLFTYLLSIMFVIPDATIHTLLELLGPSGPDLVSKHIHKLSGSARKFFEHDFNDTKEYTQTKGEVRRRVQTLLSISMLEKMLSYPKNKLDLFNEMNQGKLILINTSREALQSGAIMLGRFFIALLRLVAYQRQTAGAKRLPTFIYIDEFQEYVVSGKEDAIDDLFNQARKVNIGFTVAHHDLADLSPKLRSTLATNSSIKIAGGVSVDDARFLAKEMRCEPEQLSRASKLHFTIFVNGLQTSPYNVRITPGIIEAMPTLSGPDRADIRISIKRNYCWDVNFEEVRQEIASGKVPQDPYVIYMPPSSPSPPKTTTMPKSGTTKPKPIQQEPEDDIRAPKDW